MKKYIQLTLASLVVVLGLALAVPATSQAINVFDKACQTGTTGGGAGAPAAEGNQNTGGSGTICGSKDDKVEDLIKNVINAILVVLGMVAVIMIIIGGIRYTTSNGDASSVKGAKDTILYAVIGLIIAILAFGIVNFVVEWFL